MIPICKMDWANTYANLWVYTLSLFFYKNLFCKNIEAEINQNFKKVFKKFLRLRVELYFKGKDK